MESYFFLNEEPKIVEGTSRMSMGGTTDVSHLLLDWRPAPEIIEQPIKHILLRRNPGKVPHQLLNVGHEVDHILEGMLLQPTA
eukprot:7180339-Karenia_brevis.AAC.1